MYKAALNACFFGTECQPRSPSIYNMRIGSPLELN